MRPTIVGLVVGLVLSWLSSMRTIASAGIAVASPHSFCWFTITTTLLTMSFSRGVELTRAGTRKFTRHHRASSRDRSSAHRPAFCDRPVGGAHGADLVHGRARWRACSSSAARSTVSTVALLIRPARRWGFGFSSARWSLIRQKIRAAKAGRTGAAAQRRSIRSARPRASGRRCGGEACRAAGL